MPRVSKLRDADNELRQAVETYNTCVSELWNKHVAPAKENMNALIALASEWAEAEIASDIQNYYDERSEAWQEGDAGQAYTAWLEEWQGAGWLPTDGIELDEPEALDEPDIDLDTFEQLPEDPSR